MGGRDQATFHREYPTHVMFCSDLADKYHSHQWQRDLTASTSKDLLERKDRIHSGLKTDNDGSPSAPTTVRLLDYACGPGDVSLVWCSRPLFGSSTCKAKVPSWTNQTLAPYIAQARGIDLSDNMVKAYNERARAQGFDQSFMTAVVGNLFVDDPSTMSSTLAAADFHHFDLAIVGGGFHHFEDPELAAARLVQRIRPGSGVLLIIDLMSHNAFGAGDMEKAGVSGAEKTVKHFGFEKDVVQEFLKKAGCVDLKYEELDTVAFMNRKLFMCWGTRI